MTLVTQVTPATLDLHRFREVLDDEGFSALMTAAAAFSERFAGRAIWNVNSTAAGGGVAEMLHSLVAYARGSGVDCRWAVIAGEEHFFAATKRLHNHLHGSAGDGGALDEDVRRAYESTTMFNGIELRRLVGPGDLVILHDPQTAGLVRVLRDTGAHVVWRAHIGTDHPNEIARAAWAFLTPYLDHADAFIFSRPEHVWDTLDPARVRIIPPSIDAFSPKNQRLGPRVRDAILHAAGIVPTPPSRVAPLFHRLDGSSGRVGRQVRMLGATWLEPHLPIVCQVSRWDRLKDPVGVLMGFAEHVLPHVDSQLLLAGPATDRVADDPEGALVLAETVSAWQGLAPPARRRIALACLPMDDLEENAAIVNAVQRRSDVMVQKSLAEGFGLTVSEAMWKARPTVASRVGGIQDQIVHGESGVLLDDPSDLAGFGDAVRELLVDARAARRLGQAAQERVRREYLAARHLGQYADLLTELDAAVAV